MRIGLAALLTLPLALLLAVQQPDPVTAPNEDLRVLPRAPANCDLLPLKRPEGWEIRSDRTTPPYHLVVRLLTWPELKPRDLLEHEVFDVGGQIRPPERIGPGVYSFPGLGIALTRVAILEPDDQGPVSAAVRRRPTVVASRNPVPLARHAITECELVMVSDSEMKKVIPGRGHVFDRVTKDPVPGARLQTRNGHTATTDIDGFFEFTELLPFDHYLNGLSIMTDQHEPLVVKPKMLSAHWLRTYLESDSLVFTLMPLQPDLARVPLLEPRQSPHQRR